MSEQDLIYRIGILFFVMGVIIALKALFNYNGGCSRKEEQKNNTIEKVVKKIILKNKKGFAILHIVIGAFMMIYAIWYTPSVEYTLTYSQSSTTTYLGNPVWLLIPFIIIWCATEYLAFIRAWFYIIKENLVEYYLIAINSKNLNAIEESWCNLNYIISRGDKMEYKNINKDKLRTKAEKLISRYKLK